MSDAPLIEIRQVTKRFPGVVALKDVSFDVRRGEFHSICGENGAGKSTLMKILSGVYADYEGAILVNGQTVQFQGTRDAEEKGVSIIHQELNLVEELTVAANIFLGRELRNSIGLRSDREMEAAAKKLLEDLETVLVQLVQRSGRAAEDRDMLDRTLEKTQLLTRLRSGATGT